MEYLQCLWTIQQNATLCSLYYSVLIAANNSFHGKRMTITLVTQSHQHLEPVRDLHISNLLDGEGLSHLKPQAWLVKDDA